MPDPTPPLEDTQECYRLVTGGDSDEARAIYTVQLMDQEQRRGAVLDVLETRVLLSEQVPGDLWSMVFMPLAFGALSPPVEVMEKLLGGPKPPIPEGSPTHPPEPTYPAESKPPKRPAKLRIPKEKTFAWSWGEISEEEYQEYAAKIKGLNEEREVRHAENTACFAETLAAHKEKLQAIKAEYEASVQAWEAEVAAWDQKVAAAIQAAADWQMKGDRVFSRWYEDVGVLVGDYKDAGPRSINGYPMFMSMRIWSKSDWTRIRDAVIREQARRKEIDV